MTRNAPPTLRLATVLGVAALMAPASAAAQATPAEAPSAAPGTGLYDPNRFELRVGELTEVLGAERGGIGLNAEVVFPRFFVAPLLPKILTPRLEIGGVANVSGKTSYVYADGLWTANLTRHLFTEAYAGAVVHDGLLQYTEPTTRAALGCRVLWHVGANLGYRFSRRWSLMATYDHASTNEVITPCRPNEGLNLSGLRLSYSF